MYLYIISDLYKAVITEIGKSEILLFYPNFKSLNRKSLHIGHTGNTKSGTMALLLAQSGTMIKWHKLTQSGTTRKVLSKGLLRDYIVLAQRGTKWHKHNYCATSCLF